MCLKCNLLSAIFIYMYPTCFVTAFVPLWSLQLDDFGEVIEGADTPFAAINITMIITLVLFITGLIINIMTPHIAEDMRKLSKYVATITVLFVVIVSFYGGADMTPSLGWKEILLCCLWPFMLLGLASIYFCGCQETGSRFRASILFMLTKGFFMPAMLINSAFPHPRSDVAGVTSYFFSLITLVFGVTLNLLYVCFTRFDSEEENDSRKEKKDEMRLVIEMEATRRYVAPPPSYDDVSTEAQLRNDVMKEVAMLGMSNAAATSASFGAPVIGI